MTPLTQVHRFDLRMEPALIELALGTSLHPVRCLRCLNLVHRADLKRNCTAPPSPNEKEPQQ